MSLVKYKQKRNFKETPEPKGGTPGKDRLRFVIQKHDATRLHYDFRLEMEGVLKSWAVPKGPSTDPDVKRLAMMVEDHPYDYRTFEGIIPSGYGAGTVIVWDEGYYEPAKEKDWVKNKKVQDKEFIEWLGKGRLHFTLYGHKLKGEWALVKTGQSENSWLLFKMKDKYASKDDITLKDKSVVSKKTITQVEKTTKKFYSSNHDAKTISKKAKSLSKRPDVKAASEKNKKKAKPTKLDAEVIAILNKAPEHKFPKILRPMLATLVDKPFDAPGWLYEVKWDGYRALGFVKDGEVELKSRNDKSFNDKFYPVADALKEWNINAIVDGEIVVVKENGVSSFEALQNWRSEADGDLYYYLFDVLWLNGKDLTGLPLTERKAVLQSISPQDDNIIRTSESFEENGLKFFETARQIGLEGIIAKKADSIYYAGERSREWLKIKASKRQEMVIGGFTKNDDSGKLFSALLVGVFDRGHLVYTGKIGTGFNDKGQQEMMKQFKPLIIPNSPFTTEPDINKPSRFRPNPPHATATWLKPKLVCEVSFAEMTNDGVMRHPSFEGMRLDKKAEMVVREMEKPTESAVKEANKKSKKIVKPAKKTDAKTLLNPSEETQVKRIKGHELKFTNLSKLYWPEDKVTKRDMINYYYQVASYILPYLKDRPQSMNRHPNGIHGESFYYKDVTGKAPDWVKTFLYHSDADNRDRNYLVAEDEASLLYMASLGCIEMNPWHSRVESKDYPDWCVIDLDPGKSTFEQVIKAAQVTHEVLDELNVPSYPKTSGSTGIHIYMPFGAKHTYEQSKEFGRVIAKLVQKRLPEFTTVERVVSNRGGKLYVDFLQNRPQATISAPYSLRPKPGATVSMPLHWEEVKKGLKMKDFTIFNALDRIKSEGDIFKPVLGKGINLEKVIKAFEVKEL